MKKVKTEKKGLSMREKLLARKKELERLLHLILALSRTE